MSLRLSVIALGLALGAACDPTTPTGGGDTEPEPTLETCDEVDTALGDESARIRSCTTAEECGQVLTGTSCGCTRDLVARNDADTTEFYELMALQVELECGGMISTCDCPPAIGYDCVSNSCTWNYIR